MTATPAALATEFADLRRRLDTLERATRMPALFGAGDMVAGAENPTLSSSWTDIVNGPVVEFHVPPSGRIAVLVEAIVTVQGSLSAAATSYRITGANTLASSDLWSIATYAMTPVVPEPSQTMGMYLHEGLTPGATTLTMQVRHLGTPPSIATWSRRSLVVVPL